jgi:multidrug efflux pump subunit AcrA (membrane-fusion protein)
MRSRVFIVIVLVASLILLGLLYARADDQHEHDDRHGHEASTTRPTTQPDHHDDHDDHGHADKLGDALDEPADHADRADHADHDHAREVKLTPEAVQRYGLRVETVTAQPLRPVFTVPARIEFNGEQIAHVGTVVRGRVTEMKARLGDAVNKGDELVVLESTDLAEAQSEYLQRRAAVSVAESAVEPLKESYDRAKKLYDEHQGIALGEVQKREAELKAAEGAVLTARAAAVSGLNLLVLMGMSRQQIEQLEQSGKLNPRTVVRSPIDGRVVEREITLGELVTPETEALLVIANVQTLWVLADVPEARLSQVNLGAPAQVQIAALPNRTFDGKVSYVAPALDPHTRSAAVRVEARNDGSLKPGMFASVQLVGTASAASKVVAVREGAVQTIEGQSCVFVPVGGEANTFVPQPVKAGPAVNGLIPIRAGLKEGDQVVMRGAFILKAELGKGEAGHGH